MRLRTLALLCAFVLCAAAAGFAVFLAARGADDAPHSVVSAVGATRLTFSSAYLRPASRGGGETSRLAVAAMFPNFAPAGGASDITGKTDIDARLANTIFVAIKAADASLDPAERPSRLYARFLDPVPWTHPGGLIVRAFQPGSPFETDELFFAEPEGRDFSARCPKPDQSRKTPSTCVSEYRQDGLDVEIRFSAGLLAEWEKLNAGVRGLIEAARR